MPTATLLPTAASPFVLCPEEQLFTRKEAAAYLRCSVATMDRWAVVGEGPRFNLVGGRALYSIASLREFAGIRLAA